MMLKLTCQELVELVTDYLEGTLSEHDRIRFEDHLKGCEGCRRYLSQMRTTARLAGHLPTYELSPVMRDQLMQAFRDWNNPHNPKRA